MEPKRFHVLRDWATIEGFELFIVERGCMYDLRNLPKIAIPENELTTEKTPLRVSENEIQGLMDSLWQAGVRPSAGIASTGQLEATKAHLEDMRTMAFEATRRIAEKLK